jgi:hypothetical protein
MTRTPSSRRGSRSRCRSLVRRGGAFDARPSPSRACVCARVRDRTADPAPPLFPHQHARALGERIAIRVQVALPRDELRALRRRRRRLPAVESAASRMR